MNRADALCCHARFPRARCVHVCPLSQKTINHLSWCLITLNAMRTAEQREREVLSASKLQPNDEGKSKAGSGIAAAVYASVEALDVPVNNIDYCCTDTTNSNSGLRLPIEKGGLGGDGGAYAHLFAAFRAKGHILFFMLWCLSHLVNNEVAAVMKACGPVVRDELIRKKSKVQGDASSVPSETAAEAGADSEADEAEEAEGAAEAPPAPKKKSPKRWLLAELLNDTVCAINQAEGCRAYVRGMEALERLKQPSYGVDTRWGYYIDVAIWLQPHTGRIELIITYLLHRWLVAEGQAGLDVPEAAEGGGDDDDEWVLRGDALAHKIAQLKHSARKQLLAELADPMLRIWLIFLAVYGKRSAKRFLDFTQNDSPGIAFKAPRVIRLRIAFLEGVADASSDPLLHPEFDPLKEFVEARSAVYAKHHDKVRSIMRKAAGTAATYFCGKKGAASLPREQRALRWLNHPALLVLGLLDDKDHAVQTARELLGMAIQGTKGLVAAMLPFMPDGLMHSELEDAVLSATHGPAVAFQPESLDLIKLLAQQEPGARLLDLQGGESLHSKLMSAALHLMIGNFISETAVKTLTYLCGSQRREQRYASMLIAARHRPHRWPMTLEDYALASRQLGHSVASRKTPTHSLNLQLQQVSLSTPSGALADLLPPMDKLQESEAAEEEESDNVVSTTLPAVKVAAVRNMLSVDTIIEVLWAHGVDGEPQIYPALIVTVWPWPRT